MGDPLDLHAALALATGADPPRPVRTTDAYAFDGPSAFVLDALVGRPAWLRGAERVEERANAGVVEILASAVREAPEAAPAVSVAGVLVDRSRERLGPLLRLVDPHGDVLGDWSGRLLRRAVEALGVVDRLTYGIAEGLPLVLWKGGLVGAVVMPVAPDFGAHEGLLAGALPPRWVPPHRWDGPPLALAHRFRDHGTMSRPAQLGGDLHKFAEAIGGAHWQGNVYVVPTRVGPVRLWVQEARKDLGWKLAYRAQFAHPRRLAALLRPNPDLAHPLFEVDAVDGTSTFVVGPALSLQGAAESLGRALAVLRLAPEARPPVAAVLAENTPALFPQGAHAPRARDLLPPGDRVAYVAVPLWDATRRPVPGRWCVLDRRRWVCLGGHGTKRRAEALVARLNGLAHRPAWAP